MTSTMNHIKIANHLRSLKKFENLKDETIEALAKNAEIVEIGQGQTLLRRTAIESHAFIVVTGSLRLLGTDGISGELFTVGRADVGEVVGVIDLLRQAPCETAIGRQKTKLISISLVTISELIKQDDEFNSTIQKLRSPCEEAILLAMIQKRINPPPVDTKGWILNNIKKTEETREDLKKSNDLVLSTTLTGWIDKIGEKITQDEMSKMGDESELPIRIVELARDNSVYKYPEKETSSERASTRIWETKESVDFEAVGLKVAKSDTDLQGFKPIKGSGKVGTALATIKMVAKAYEHHVK